ncbi:hypothetical protein [Flavobacterium agrisoli]|uniref:Uncharacterized protein n=1 Tax=Flavobacterium agrisoli TaxID=2793066 RepID=A0A934PPB6_9FLAO|nr:hypothetical protein [Flavobacterium agrisoli]MBK0370870.1 hypothetical protein [Flavobacterium agrisoli]
MNVKLFRVIFFVSLILSANSALAQSSSKPNLIIKPKVNDDNSVDFKYLKEGIGSYVAVVEFTKLLNSETTGKQVVNVNEDTGVLFKLKPIDTTKKIDLSFRYAVHRGFLNPKIDSTTVYYLPFEKNKKIKTYDIYRQGFDNNQWKAHRVYSTTQDTVFAMRKGQVVEIRSLFSTSANDATGALTSVEKKEIILQHPDNTFTSYFDIDDKTILVKPGDVLSAHQPLCLMASYLDKNKNVKFTTRFKIYYLVFNDADFSPSEKTIDAHFLTGNGIEKLVSKTEYTVAIP